MTHGMTSQGMTPPSAKGKKMRESAPSPTSVEAMARHEKAEAEVAARRERDFMMLMT